MTEEPTDIDSADNVFEKLPDHLLIEIFIRVPISEWAQVSCVKKRWAMLFRGECLWQTALLRTWPTAGQAKRWPGPIRQGLSRRRYAALYVSKHIFAFDDDIDELVGHTYLFLKEQLELPTMPPPSGILHGTIIDQFIACGKSRDKAHELASQIWLAVINNLEENEHTFLLLKRLAQEGDKMVPDMRCHLWYSLEISPLKHRDFQIPGTRLHFAKSMEGEFWMCQHRSFLGEILMLTPVPWKQEFHSRIKKMHHQRGFFAFLVACNGRQQKIFCVSISTACTNEH